MKKNGNMNITLNEIRMIFNNLINEIISREDAAKWAKYVNKQKMRVN